MSTPCTNTHGNVCTIAGYEVSATNPDLGVYLQTHMLASYSTPCPDTDSSACTTAGCNGQGVCDQNHMMCVVQGQIFWRAPIARSYRSQTKERASGRQRPAAPSPPSMVPGVAATKAARSAWAWAARGSCFSA